VPKPKINVTQVWILQRVVEHDGSEILNVHLDPEEVKKEHTDLGTWSYDEKEDYYTTSNVYEYYLLTRHPILVTRKTKPDQRPPRRFIPCIPGNAPDGTWRCATCGQPSDKDCLEGPHVSNNPNDWYQPDLVQEYFPLRPEEAP
jgi:hypothetical protein